MNYLNKSQMKKEIRLQIDSNFGSCGGFASYLNIDVNAVYAVLNQDRDVPKSWMKVLGYERVVVYTNEPVKKTAKEIAVDIAKKHAFIAGKKNQHDYLPKTKQELEDWTPHEWVINSIRGCLAMKNAKHDDE